MDIDRVEDVLDDGVDDDGDEYGIFESEDELHTSPLGESALVSVLHEEPVQGGKYHGQGYDPVIVLINKKVIVALVGNNDITPEVKQYCDDRTSFHEVHPLLGEPVERLQKQEERE